VQKSSTGAASAIDDRLGEQLDVLAVVCLFVGYVVDQTAPTAANSDDSMSIAQRANGDRSYCGIQSGDIAAARQNSNRALGQLRLLELWT
jgi:hypothetical protein